MRYLTFIPPDFFYKKTSTKVIYQDNPDNGDLNIQRLIQKEDKYWKSCDETQIESYQKTLILTDFSLKILGQVHEYITLIDGLINEGFELYTWCENTFHPIKNPSELTDPIFKIDPATSKEVHEALSNIKKTAKEVMILDHVRLRQLANSHHIKKPLSIQELNELLKILDFDKLMACLGKLEVIIYDDKNTPGSDLESKINNRLPKLQLLHTDKYSTDKIPKELLSYTIHSEENLVDLITLNTENLVELTVTYSCKDKEADLAKVLNCAKKLRRLDIIGNSKINFNKVLKALPDTDEGALRNLNNLIAKSIEINKDNTKILLEKAENLQYFLFPYSMEKYSDWLENSHALQKLSSIELINPTDKILCQQAQCPRKLTSYLVFEQISEIVNKLPANQKEHIVSFSSFQKFAISTIKEFRSLERIDAITMGNKKTLENYQYPKLSKIKCINISGNPEEHNNYMTNEILKCIPDIDEVIFYENSYQTVGTIRDNIKNGMNQSCSDKKNGHQNKNGSEKNLDGNIENDKREKPIDYKKYITSGNFFTDRFIAENYRLDVFLNLNEESFKAENPEIELEKTEIKNNQKKGA